MVDVNYENIKHKTRKGLFYKEKKATDGWSEVNFYFLDTWANQETKMQIWTHEIILVIA